MGWIDRTWSGTPVYLRLTDLSHAPDEASRKARHTSISMHAERRDLLQITTTNNTHHAEFRPTRLTVEQARQLRDAIDKFLADQDRPDSDFTPPPRAEPANPFARKATT